MSGETLPANWVKCTLADIGKVVSGGTPSTEVPDYWGNDVRWISPSDLTGYKSKFISRGAKSISDLGLDNCSAKLMPAGSVHFSSRAPIGYVVISSESLCTNQGFKSLVLGEGVFNEYVYFYLKSIKALANSLATGTTFKELSGSAFAKLPFPLPPLAEQKRIVAKIEELFSELEAGEESLRVARRQLGVYRQSLLKQAFEGKLTENWRTQNPAQVESPAELLARIQSARQTRYEQQLKEWETNGKSAPKPRKPKLVDPLSEVEIASLPRVPDCWCWEKNERYVFEVKDGTHDTPQYVENGIPFITQKHIQEGHIVFDDFKQITQLDHERFSERSNVEEGDLLISMIGKPGSCAIVRTTRPFSIKNVGLFKFFADLQSAAFLCYFYQSQGGLGYVMQFAKGGLQPFLGLKELRFWPVPVCSLPEQQEIVRLLDTQFEVIEQNEREIDAALKRSEALRQAILKKAFTGRLVAQDPADEPASELLARLRAGHPKPSNSGGRRGSVAALS